MSRVRFLNLPQETNEQSLKEHITKNLAVDAPPVVITDAFIKRTKDGKIRMAFLGFKSSAAGEYVIKRFHGTYFGPLKLDVQAAIAVGTRDEPRSSAHGNGDGHATRSEQEGAKKRKDTPHDAKEEPDEKQKRREDFVNQRLNQNTSSSWAGEVLAPAEEKVKDDASESSDDEPQNLEGVSDTDFLAMLNKDEDNKTAAAPHDASPEDEANDAPVVEDRSNVQLASQTKRVRAYNIPFAASEGETKNYFSSKFGNVEDVVVPLTKDTKQSKGVAFVQFSSSDSAVRAVEEGNMSVFMGRLIRVEGCDMPKKQEADPTAAGGTVGNSSYKNEKAAELKDKDSSLKWNSLYMQSHAAVSTMAQRLNVDRKDIVSVENTGAAVRAAVAEAILTSEAKNVLGDDSINFDKVNGSSQQLNDTRSNTTILVKNLLPNTDMNDLTKMFKRFGQIETLAVPTGSAFALFSFSHSQDARTAFQRMAYKKFNGTVLFLEWAPLGSIVDNDEPTESGDTKTEGSSSTETLYITNLPFGATEASLKIFICDTASRVATKADQYIKRINVVSDKGRAYVEVSDTNTFQYLCSKLNGKTFEGRTIAAVAAVGAKNTKTSDDLPAGCDPLKVIVKNLPFEATEADLRELFKSFSEVKAVRVPRKVHTFSSHRDNNHRGFGFVEFLTEEEAARAIKSLSNTHLYGRHLVLQYAKMHE